MSEQELYALLGKFASWLLSAAGGAGLLLLFLKIWGQNWIESKFLKDLELFKAQKLHEFDILLKRKIKWHEKEHESLSESWKKLVMAHRSLKGAIFSFRKSPDLERMSREEFNRFLESGDLSNDEKEYLTGNREGLNTAYSRILDIRSLNDAHKAFLEFNLYFDTNKIFLRPHIKEKFQEADDYIWSAWVSQKMSYDLRDSKADFAIKALDTEKDKIAPLIKDIENIVQKELFPEQKQESENSR
ncbi:hypothetical protein [Nitrospina watsonii]|uniref:Uncharacterized protein n=1 Tax=Nitrospina watsonii TaxID=1323948 RepID=A0ABM9HBP4_9BACT|nr:hypothetical protein [Nitrospina watsonii]CAI2717523.1 conserved protein of unknown function [Nitrospina watsonii]